MTVDEAIVEAKTKITALCAGANIEQQRVSDEEARLSVYVPADKVDPIREALREPTMQWLVADGLDVQVFVYDAAAPRGTLAAG